MKNMTEKFAEFCEELKYEDLPPEVIKRTKLLMNEKDLELKKKENDNLQEIFYKGAPKKGQL